MGRTHRFLTKLRCIECGCEIEIPNQVEQSEVLSCPSCGTDYIYNGSEFIQSELDGCDWGE